MLSKITESDIRAFSLELRSFCINNPLCFEDDDEGLMYFENFIDSRFDKFWPHLLKEDV